MNLSAPIYRLKRQARSLSRQEGITHHEALDRVARKEGFGSWSLLMSKLSEHRPCKRLRNKLQNGDLVLIGARPGQGKTLLGLEIAVEAMKSGHQSVFFSLECTGADIDRYFAAIGEKPDDYTDRFDFYDSDDVCATYIASCLPTAAPGTVVIVDYLQLLDQKRSNPDLTEQVRHLKSFAKETGVVMVFVSQIYRNFDPKDKPTPTLDDVRLPNHLDLTLFDKACFLHDGEMGFASIG